MKREPGVLAVTHGARTELLNSLEALSNLLYIVQQGGAESTRYLAEIKQELDRATTLLLTMQEC